MPTIALKKAFAEASKLNEDEQDALAELILQEMASEHRWEKVFSNSSDKLAKLADEALIEHRKKQTRLLDPEKL